MSALVARVTVHNVTGVTHVDVAGSDVDCKHDVVLKVAVVPKTDIEVLSSVAQDIRCLNPQGTETAMNQ